MSKFFKLLFTLQILQKIKSSSFQHQLIAAETLFSLVALSSCTIDPEWMNIYFPDDSGAQIILEWDQNTEPDLSGYKIYFSTSSGMYENVIDVSNNTSYTITGLDIGTTYFITATAYNVYGMESGFAEELAYSVPDGENPSI